MICREFYDFFETTILKDEIRVTTLEKITDDKVTIDFGNTSPFKHNGIVYEPFMALFDDKVPL